MHKQPKYLDKYKKHGSPFTELFGLYNYDEEDLENLGSQRKMYDKIIKLLDNMTKDNYRKTLKKIYDMRNEACGDDGLFQACAYAWPAVAEMDKLEEGKMEKKTVAEWIESEMTDEIKDEVIDYYKNGRDGRGPYLDDLITYKQFERYTFDAGFDDQDYMWKPLGESTLKEAIEPERYQRANGKETLTIKKRYKDPFGKKEYMDVVVKNSLGHCVQYQMISTKELENWKKVEKPVEPPKPPKIEMDRDTCYHNAIKDYKKGAFKHIGIDVLKRDGFDLEDLNTIDNSSIKLSTAFANQIAMRWAAEHNVNTRNWFEKEETHKMNRQGMIWEFNEGLLSSALDYVFDKVDHKIMNWLEQHPKYRPANWDELVQQRAELDQKNELLAQYRARNKQLDAELKAKRKDLKLVKKQAKQYAKDTKKQIKDVNAYFDRYIDAKNDSPELERVIKQLQKSVLKEETYVDKNLKPKKLSKSQKQGLSDDGFVDLITAKVVDDFIKGNNETMKFWDFWDWVLDTGYGLVMCDLITSAVKKNDLEVLTADYDIYKNMKKEIKKDPESFVDEHGFRFDKKTQNKLIRAGK